MTKRSEAAGKLAKLPTMRAVCLAGISAFALGAVLAVLPGTAMANSAKTLPDQAAAKPVRSGPLTLVVSLKKQTMTMYQGGEVINSSRVSTGKIGHSTPAGIYSILHKRRRHFSNLYDNAPMPFMQRLTWSGIALHQGHVPNYPASHGCIRLPRATASSLFKTTNVGAHVVIAPDEVVATDLGRIAMFSPFVGDVTTGSVMAQDIPVLTEAEKKALPAKIVMKTPSMPVVDAKKVKTKRPIRALITLQTKLERVRAAQSMLNVLGYDLGKADGLVGRNTRRAFLQFQKIAELPETGQFSDDMLNKLYGVTGTTRQDGHLYVRQGFKPLFDGVVGLATSDKPLGTHVLNAHLREENGKPALTWSGLSIDPESDVSVQDALARVTIPADLRARLVATLSEGASIILTDQGMSRETTKKGTDFIVQLKRKRAVTTNIVRKIKKKRRLQRKVSQIKRKKPARTNRSKLVQLRSRLIMPRN